jgi:type II secretory pathway pseudopilin PulG
MRRRQGFTITELLVAFALIIFIMLILTEAFTAGLESFRQLKALGDMQEKLRSAVIILRRDLQAEHFEDSRGSRLSDINLLASNAPQNDPPDAGYFRLWQKWNGDSTPYNPANPGGSLTWCSTREGIDSSGLPVTRATDHILAFTVRLRGNLPGDYFTTALPNINPGEEAKMRQMGPPDFQYPPYPASNNMYSQWAEVVYFLRPKPDRSAGATPLYALYRRQRLLGTENNNVNIPAAQNAYDSYPEVSFPPPTGTPSKLNDKKSITEPPNRFGSVPGSPAGMYDLTAWSLEERLSAANAMAGDDLLLTNVVSFDVKVIQQGFPTDSGIPFFSDLPPISSGVYRNPAFSGAGYCVFDTWSKNPPGYGPNGWDNPGNPTSLPLKIRILALQITIRVWDDRTGLTRQTTIIQDM